jgi:hypothetical protein
MLSLSQSIDLVKPIASTCTFESISMTLLSYNIEETSKKLGDLQFKLCISLIHQK